MSLFLQQLLARARRYPVATISIFLIVVAGAGDYLLWQERNKQAERYEQKRQQGEAMLLSLNSHPRIVAQSATVEEALAYIDRNLVAESDLAGNLDYFYQIEKSAKIRITISQLSSQPSPEEEAYRAIPFSLRLTGAYAQILDYLHQLETGPRLLRVKNYRFSQVDSAAADGLSLDLTVEMLGRP